MVLVLLLLGLCSAQTLPALEATTLSGAAVVLPAEAPAERTVLLLGFKQAHQEGFDAWRPELAVRAEDPRVDWLELPFVDVGWVLRKIIGPAMDRQIRDPAVRSRFAPVWASGDPVREALGIPGEDQLAIAVVDPAGAVLWWALGGPTPEALAELDRALAR